MFNWIKLEMTSSSNKLTVEALEKHHHDQNVTPRRSSVFNKDGLNIAGPTIRRQSRPEHRLSVPVMGGGRRYSQISRTSISGTSVGTKLLSMSSHPIKLQNTYRMEPTLRADIFNPTRVENIMHTVLEAYLKGETYDAKMSTNLAQNISEVIKGRVKDLGYTRYKLVCNVLIGQDIHQDVRVASRCLWDDSLDNYATVNYKNGNLFAIASMYATYFE